MSHRTFLLPLGGGPDPSTYYTKAEIDQMIAPLIDKTVDDLENYYLKTETYTQAEVQSLVGALEHFVVVSALPTEDIKTNVIYLLGPIGTGSDQYEEYIFTNNQWVKIGDTSVDLSNYYTKSETDALLNEKEDKKPYVSLERMGSYLYKVTFDNIPDYEPIDTNVSGGCTSFIRGGKLYRNLDWNYSEANEFLVVGKGFKGMSMISSITDDNMDDALIGQLPYHINDGVNEYGIMVSSHILFNDFEHTYSGSTDIYKLPYIVLTTLKSMEDINDLATVLADINIPAGLADNEYLMQFMVSDGTTTYAITPSDSGYEIVDITALPKLTNFKWLNKTTVERNDADLQTRPTGIERWNAVETSSLEDLRFTLAYESDDRLSEFIGIDDTTKDSTDAELEAIYTTAHAAYLTRTRDGLTWQTMHSIVYATDGIEHLSVQENWDRDYFFDKDTVYTAGENVTITDNVISATDTTYTAGENITIDENNVISATGGGGNQWFGTQAEFDNLGTYDADTDYFISSIRYDEIKGAPNPADYYKKTEVDAKDTALNGKIGAKMEGAFMTQEEFDAITPLEGNNYFIEGHTVPMVFTFDDDTTATYYVLQEE